MKRIIFIFLLLFFILSAVNAADDNITSENSTLSAADISDIELSNDNVLSKPLVDNDTYSLNSSSGKSSSEVKIQSKNLVKYHKNSSQFSLKIVDGNKNPISGVKVKMSLNGNKYVKTTNKQGVVVLKVNLKPGKYTVVSKYGGKTKKNTVKVLPRVTAKNVVVKYSKSTKFSVKVVDDKGKKMIKQLVKFKIKGKTYKRYTNSKGVAVLGLNLNAGTYTIGYWADGITGKKKIKIKNQVKLLTYRWNSGADVTKNKKIKANIPNSALVKKVIKAAKSGTPVVKFKGGKGKAVFISAGVHGNELSSQIAAMKLIKYFENHPVKGTVYIMPFMNPKGTASNVRDYAGIHLNKRANVKGSISYKTVGLITKFKCSAYGDFHCTRPGGNPGKDVAMGTYKPTYKSAVMAKYISKKSNVKCLIYNKAGQEYPGALEDVVSLKHIPAVTCEVITPHGTIAKGSVSKSLSMMKSLLKFNALL